MSFLTKLCCLCLQNNNVSLNLSDVGSDNIKIMDKLIFCIPELTYNISHIPVFICTTCHDRLISFYELKLTCIKTYKYFVQHINAIEQSKIMNNSNELVAPEFINVKTESQNEEDSETESQNKLDENKKIKEEVVDTSNLNEEEKIIIDVDPDLEAHSCTEIETSNTNSEPLYNQNYKLIATEKKIRKVEAKRNPVEVPTDEIQYGCKYCKKQFKSRKYLTVHLKLHTGEKPFVCSICQKRFLWKGHLNDHLRVHVTDKPFSCSICQNKFLFERHLKNHMRIHEEKLFCCSVCQKKFRWNSHLVEHMRIHSGIKPFRCKICDKKFAVQSNLTLHMKTH